MMERLAMRNCRLLTSACLASPPAAAPRTARSAVLNVRLVSVFSSLRVLALVLSVSNTCGWIAKGLRPLALKSPEVFL